MENKHKGLAFKLRKVIEASTGTIKKVLATVATITRQSMARNSSIADSHPNNITHKNRASLKQQMINGIIHISLNGEDSSLFGPRKTICEFPKRKDRSNRQSCNELYEEQGFVGQLLMIRGHSISTYALNWLKFDPPLPPRTHTYA